MSKPRGPGKPFQHGNRFGKGRPVGSRNKSTLALQALLDGDGEAITRKAINLAKSGNESARRLCLERLIPPRRERTVRLKLNNRKNDFVRYEALTSNISKERKLVVKGKV